MLNAHKLLKLGNGILEIGATPTHLFVLDSGYTLHLLNPDSFELVRSVVLSKAYESPHRYANGFAVACDDHLHIPLLGAQKSMVVSVKEKIAKVTELQWHAGDIESASFSRTCGYLATGGSDGRVYLYSGKDYHLITALPPRADYICDLAFSHNADYLISSGFDKYSVIFDLVRNRVHAVIKAPDVVEKARFFQNDERICLVLRNGACMIYDVMQKKSLSSENLFQSWPSALDISEDGLFAVVGSRSEMLFVVRMEDNVKMLDVKLEYSGVPVVRFHREYLLIGSVDGTLAIVHYTKGADELEKHLSQKAYAEARKVVDGNLFLTIHPKMKQFDEDWPEVMQKAITMLNANKIEEAVHFVEPFMSDPKRHNEFNFYLMQKNVVSAFAQAVSAREYQKAYEMVDLNGFLSKTAAFSELEGHWNRIFHQARKLLEENALLNQKKCKQLLEPFEHTHKKEMVYHLMKNGQMFEQADALIKKRSFQGYFALVQKHPVLADADLYKRVILLGEKMLDDFMRLEQEQKFAEALAIVPFLEHFPPFKRAITERMALISAKQGIIEALEKNNTKKVYEWVERFEILKNMPQFRKEIEAFNAKYDHCRLYALEGSAKRVMSCLSLYREIGFWADKVALLLKSAYLVEIGRALENKEVNWPMTLKRYVDRFGKEDELQRLLEGKPQIKLLEEIEGDGDRQGYRRHPYPDEIVIYKVTPGSGA